MTDLDALSGLEEAARRRRGFLGRLRRLAPWLILIALLGGGYAAQVVMAAPVVETGRVVRRSPIADREITTANGYVVARTRASVASKVQGRLVKVLVDEGDVVEVNQLLAEVEHDEQDAQVAEAAALYRRAKELVPVRDANLKEAKAQLVTEQATLAERHAGVAEAQAVVKEADAAFQRVEYLFQKQIRGDADLDQARQNRDVARAREVLARTALATAESRVKRAEAFVEVTAQQLKLARHDIEAAAAAKQRAEATRDNAYIRAPFSGMVLRREAEPGEVVSPANTGASGSKTAVVTLADFSSLEVEVDVYERDIARVAEQTPCRVVLDAYPDQLLPGKVRLLRPTADRTRATIQVYVAFGQVPEYARPEMGARVGFYLEGTEVLVPDEVAVPAAAVVEQGGETVVWALVGKALRRRTVELAPASEGGEFRIVKHGLKVGETVVLDPVAEFEEGMEVVDA